MSSTTSASTSGTSRYRDRFGTAAASNHFRPQQGLQLSSIGIGTYLGAPDDAVDQRYVEAVIRAVQLGCNVIDSAANYRFQRSERSIGVALQRLSNELDIARDELVVCTKGGYLPFDGAPPSNVRDYIQETFVTTGVATFDDFVGGSHCMTPAYLQNQLDQSLKNLNTESIDVYYIHNPESQLGHISEAEFYYRIEAAFERLEANRQQQKLRHYGIASWNGFRSEAGSGKGHSLVRMVELAQRLAGNNHGFRFIQLPFNLAMPEALTLLNEVLSGQKVTVLEAAEQLGVTVMASASMMQGRVAANLPDDVRNALGSLSTDAQTAIQFVRSTPGITTALVGMSRVEHVEENLQLAKVEPVTGENFSQLFS